MKDEQPLLNETQPEKLRPQIWRRCAIFCLGAVGVGAAAVLFWAASSVAHKSLHGLLQLSPYIPIILTPLGFALIATITNKYFLEALGSGVPQTIAALKSPELSNRRRLLSLPIAAAKLGLTACGQMCGASIGREGPMVQIGACLMHSLGRFIPTGKMSRHQIDRSLIAAGGAAGVAAAFNTPLVGIVFGLEQLVKSIETRTSAAILAAVTVATVVTTSAADYRYFGPTNVALSLFSGWKAILVCGIVGGFLGGLFCLLLVQSPKVIPAVILRFKQASPIQFAALCGLCIALLGVLSNSTIYGNGSQETKLLLQGSVHVPLGFSLLKFLAIFFSCFSGIPGGMFAPSLAVGAGVGADVSALMSYAPAGPIILLGIAAYFSGMFRAPITGVVVVLEMAGCYSMALPLLAVAFIATATSRLVCRALFYETTAERWLVPATVDDTKRS